jgi:addiction module HigA family antidote
MAILNAEERTTKPANPGEMLREDFMLDYGLTVASLAEALGVSRQTVNEILRERRAISLAMALLLSRFFGNSPEFRLNAQRMVDLREEKKRQEKKLRRLQPLSAA